MNGSIELQNYGQNLVMVLKGYIEKEAAQLILNHYNHHRQKGIKSFIIDFSRVTLINSFALSCLLDMVSENMGDAQIGFYFCGIPESCYYGISAVGLMNCATEFDTLDQAKSELGF